MKNTALVVLAGLLASIAILAQAQTSAPAFLQVRADIPHGLVQPVVYRSKSLKTDRKMMVYTPPGYEKATSRYPLLYLRHGSGSVETSWTKNGKADVILENLIADGKLKPL